MSQPKDYGPNGHDPYDIPLTSFDQLVAVFTQAEKQSDQRLLGVEYELFGQINHGQDPLPYEGPSSITSLFKQLANNSKDKMEQYEPIFEGTNIVALNHQKAVIALEPGGQIEIAARPYSSLKNLTQDLSSIVQDIKNAAQDLGIDLFALGVHPRAQQSEMAQVKKARYQVMHAYMRTLPGLGLDMMKRSCAIQINLDFKNEHDMVQKMRLACALVPFYSLLCSSAAFINGKPTSHAVERGQVWRYTDPKRTGIPSIIFDKNFGYAAWIHFVLDVPMYFIRRGSSYHAVAGASFRSFMAQGLLGFTATVRDFVDHMSTVFTEVRLKPILELRSPDSLPLPMVHAIAALTWALFYNDKAHEKAHTIFAGLTHEEIIKLRNDVIDIGRNAQFRNKPIYESAAELLATAQIALDDMDKNDVPPNLLQPLFRLVSMNTTYAEWIKSHFAKLDKINLLALVKDFDPFNDPLA